MVIVSGLVARVTMAIVAGLVAPVHAAIVAMWLCVIGEQQFDGL